MKISKLIQALEKSKTFKEFKKTKEGKNAFLCAAFIILNIKQNSFENSLDFRDEKNIFTFKLASDSEVIMQKEEILPSRKQLEEIKESVIKKIKIEPEDLREIVENQIEEKKIIGNLEEVIAVLQSQEDKLVWNLTCIVSGFVILSVQIDALSGELLKFEKKNLLDFVSIKKPGEKPEKKQKMP